MEVAAFLNTLAEKLHRPVAVVACNWGSLFRCWQLCLLVRTSLKKQTRKKRMMMDAVGLSETKKPFLYPRKPRQRRTLRLER